MFTRYQAQLDTYEDALWHCAPCEDAGRLATYNTQLLLEAHVAAGHSEQTEEEWELQVATVRPIEAQVIPEPEPYYDWSEHEQPAAEVDPTADFWGLT